MLVRHYLKQVANTYLPYGKIGIDLKNKIEKSRVVIFVETY